jgi:hypothetical protein
MQPLEATGIPLGQDVPVAADAAGTPTLIRELLPLDDTTFLVLFQKGPEMFGRRFSMACDLTPLDADDDFLRDVSFLPAGESRVAAALLPGGEFAVVWPSEALASADADGTAIYLRRFGADGATLDATPILVNTVHEGSQIHPTLTVDSAGNITVVWQDGLDVNRWGHAIAARRFDADGRAMGPEFRMSDPPENTVRFPLTATLPDDVLLVVWADRSPNGTETSFQRFERDGRSLDDVPAIANVSRAGRQQPLGLVVNHRGEFLIGYDDGQGCESGCPAELSRGRVFRANGQPLDAGERLFPNSHSAFMAGVAMPDGEFRILYGDDNWRSAQMRQVNVVE